MVYQYPGISSGGGYSDPQHYEILDGRKTALPSPKPNHVRVVNNIMFIFKKFLSGKTCEAFSEMDIFITENDTVKPDISVICDPDVLDTIKKRQKAVGVPHLIAEVLSPGTAARDRGYKMELYARCGVREYWIISIDELSVSVYILKNGVYRLSGTYQIYPIYELEDMTDEEKSEIITEFKTTIFDTLVISVEEIFEKVDR